MAATNTSNVLGLQKEKVLSIFPKLFLMGEDKVITEIMRNGGLGSVQVSKRSLRIPLQIAPGGKGRLANFDGGTLGVVLRSTLFPASSPPKASSGLLSPRPKRTGERTPTISPSLRSMRFEQAQQMENFKQFLDALFFSPSGTLGVISAISGSVITVANANNFYNGQDVLFYASLGGAGAFGYTFDGCGCGCEQQADHACCSASRRHGGW
jgi:hypothetical protein